MSGLLAVGRFYAYADPKALRAPLSPIAHSAFHHANMPTISLDHGSIVPYICPYCGRDAWILDWVVPPDQKMPPCFACQGFPELDEKYGQAIKRGEDVRITLMDIRRILTPQKLQKFINIYAPYVQHCIPQILTQGGVTDEVSSFTVSCSDDVSVISGFFQNMFINEGDSTLLTNLGDDANVEKARGDGGEDATMQTAHGDGKDSSTSSTLPAARGDNASGDGEDDAAMQTALGDIAADDLFAFLDDLPQDEEKEQNDKVAPTFVWELRVGRAEDSGVVDPDCDSGVSIHTHHKKCGSKLQVRRVGEDGQEYSCRVTVQHLRSGKAEGAAYNPNYLAYCGCSNEKYSSGRIKGPLVYTFGVKQEGVVRQNDEDRHNAAPWKFKNKM